MSLITPENVKEHAAWRVTTTGRIYRPVRMRPGHPLPDHPSSTAKAVPVSKGDKKPRKRVLVPPNRARRRTIDPTKWGSQHLKGVLLENDTSLQVTHRTELHGTAEENESESEEEDEEEDEWDDADNEAGEDAAEPSEDEAVKAPQQPDPSSDDADGSPDPPPTTLSPAVDHSNLFATSHTATDSEPNLAAEKNTSLGLLHSLFGQGDTLIKRDDLDSDLEMDIAEERKTRKVMAQEDHADDIEIVPLAKPQRTETTQVSLPDTDPKEVDAQPATSANPSQPRGLKELFAPREEEG